MHFLAKFRPEKIVAWFSRGAVPVDGQLWIQTPRATERETHGACAQSPAPSAAQCLSDGCRDAA
jgi:hypothetical protein